MNIDEVKIIDDFTFTEKYSEMTNCFLGRVLSKVACDPTEQSSPIRVTRLKELVHNNITYRSGAFLLSGWDDLNTPSFMEIADICMYKDLKFFVVSKWITCEYEWESNCYIVEEGQYKDLVLVCELEKPMATTNVFKQECQTCH